MKLRPRRRIVFESTSVTQKVLTQRDVRGGDDDSPQQCAVWYNKLLFGHDCESADWLQGPTCQNVFHDGCILKMIENEEFSCPICRRCFAESDLELWSPEELFSDMFDDDFKPGRDTHDNDTFKAATQRRRRNPERVASLYKRSR